jgi:hypothetical protein
MVAYDVADRNTARSIGTENLRRSTGTSTGTGTSAGAAGVRAARTCHILAAR